jgi:hypothetical protein
MMDTTTGEFRFIDESEFRRYMSGEPAPPNQMLMHGTEEQMLQVSRAVKVGNRELANRQARRKAQRQARKRNR